MAYPNHPHPYTQVVLWDLSSEADRLGRRAGDGKGAEGGAAGAKGPDGTPPSAPVTGSGAAAAPSLGDLAGGAGGSSTDGDAHIPVVKHRFMTDTQFSHHQVGRGGGTKY